MGKQKAWLTLMLAMAFVAGTAQICSGELTCTPDCEPTTYIVRDGSYREWHDGEHDYVDVGLSGWLREWRFCMGHQEYGPCCGQCGDDDHQAPLSCGGYDDWSLWDFMYPPECWSDLGEVPNSEWRYEFWHCAGMYKIHDITYHWIERYETTGCPPGQRMTYDPDHNNYVPPPVEKGSGEWGPPVGLRPMPGSKAEDSLHAFGDVLPYQFLFTAPLPVRAWLTTSTYEGRCMNYPVNYGGTTELDTISDMVPDSLTGGWHLVNRWHHDDRSCYLVERTCPTGFSYLNLRVLDYAAEGDLVAYRADNELYILYDSQKIPRNYEQFRSRSDSDSDGFTAWEEHRGFKGIGGQDFVRLDTNQAEMLVDNGYAYLQGATLDTFQTMCECSVINCHGIPFVCFETSDDSREFVDYESNHFSKVGNDGEWVADTLCDPGYNPPRSPDAPGSEIADVDQGIIRIVPSYGLHGGMGSYTCGATDQLPRGTSPLPGGDACNGILMYETSLDSLVRWLWLNGGLQLSDTHAVRALYSTRNVYHEFGHAQGIIHHHPDSTAGLWQCVMKYTAQSDYVTPWSLFIARGPGTEYSDDDWQCAIQRHLRPH